MKLWHGGIDLEHSYNEVKKASKGRWEYGPGLYLTTHYETARKYAKGGGKTYHVHIELGNSIHNVKINLDETLSFIKDNVVKSKQKELIVDLHNNMKRMNLVNEVEANVLLNLIINSDAVVGEKTIKLNEFLVQNKADYSIVDRFSGRDETVVVIFNPKQIKKVSPIKSSEASLEEYELPFENPIRKKVKP